jgi:transposase-like protein
LKQVVTWFLNEVMNQEAVQQTGASRYERTRSKVAYRNGVRRGSLRTRYGDITLDKPVPREVPFITRVFERYSRIERSLESVILESYLQGVSTRKVQEVISHLGVDKISPSYVSSLTKELDGKVQEFLTRPVDPYIPYLFVGASYFKVREGVRYLNKALLLIAGIREDGIREILGARIADCENELTWEDLFSELRDRGLEKTDLVISDGHRGIQSAVERSFPGSSWQTRKILWDFPVREIFDFPCVPGSLPPGGHPKDPEKALQGGRSTSERVPERSPETPGVCSGAGGTRVSQGSRYGGPVPPRIVQLPECSREHWRRIRTTNLLERVNGELKRRYHSIGAFPNDAAVLRLAGAILMDINEEWITSRRYLSFGEEITCQDTGAQFTA